MNILDNYIKDAEIIGISKLHTNVKEVGHATEFYLYFYVYTKGCAIEIRTQTFTHGSLTGSEKEEYSRFKENYLIVRLDIVALLAEFEGISYSSMMQQRDVILKQMSELTPLIRDQKVRLKDRDRILQILDETDEIFSSIGKIKAVG
jgi:hypothetical protein